MNRTASRNDISYDCEKRAKNDRCREILVQKTLKSYHLKNANMFITDNLSCGDLEYKQRFLGKFSIWRNPIGKQKNKKC